MVGESGGRYVRECRKLRYYQLSKRKKNEVVMEKGNEKWFHVVGGKRGGAGGLAPLPKCKISFQKLYQFLSESTNLVGENEKCYIH